MVTALSWSEIKILFIEINRMQIFPYKVVVMTRDYFPQGGNIVNSPVLDLYNSLYFESFQGDNNIKS